MIVDLVKTHIMIRQYVFDENLRKMKKIKLKILRRNWNLEKIDKTLLNKNFIKMINQKKILEN
jgi:hypothetical protein